MAQNEKQSVVMNVWFVKSLGRLGDEVAGPNRGGGKVGEGGKLRKEKERAPSPLDSKVKSDFRIFVAGNPSLFAVCWKKPDFNVYFICRDAWWFRRCTSTV